MNLDICRLTMPDKAGRFAYVQNGRWITVVDTGQKFIPAPVLNNEWTACRMLMVEPLKGSRLSHVTDPLEMRVAAALIELAWQAFPVTENKRESSWDNKLKSFTHAATCDRKSVPAWKVVACILWPTWESAKDTLDTRAAELRGRGYNITAEQLKDALKRDSALKLLRESKKK
jgi:hypothetical protein